MPKLDQKTAAAVKGAGLPDDFTLVPDGLYVARFRFDEVIPAKDRNSFPQWKCEFTIVEDVTEGGTGETHAGRKLPRWYSLSTKDYPRQMLNELFTALGLDASADLEDGNGSDVVIAVSHSVAQRGKLEGKEVNDIDHVFPADYGLESGGGTPSSPSPEGGGDDELGEEPF